MLMIQNAAVVMLLTRSKVKSMLFIVWDRLYLSRKFWFGTLTALVNAVLPLMLDRYLSDIDKKRKRIKAKRTEMVSSSADAAMASETEVDIESRRVR